MKKAYIILLLFIISHHGKAQDNLNCSLLPGISTNTSVSFYLKEITEEDYKSAENVNPNALEMFTNSDSIEAILQIRYPKLFKKENNKYIFKTYDGQNIIVENNLLQEKGYSKYSFKAEFEHYIIIFQEFYEGSNSILIDTKSGIAYLLPDKPYFITNSLVYSYGDDYGTTDLTIIDIDKNESISFMFDNLHIVSSYSISIHIRFKIFCPHSNQNKYLEVLKY